MKNVALLIIGLLLISVGCVKPSHLEQINQNVIRVGRDVATLNAEVKGVKTKVGNMEAKVSTFESKLAPVDLTDENSDLRVFMNDMRNAPARTPSPDASTITTTAWAQEAQKQVIAAGELRLTIDEVFGASPTVTAELDVIKGRLNKLEQDGAAFREAVKKLAEAVTTLEVASRKAATLQQVAVLSRQIIQIKELTQEAIRKSEVSGRESNAAERRRAADSLRALQTRINTLQTYVPTPPQPLAVPNYYGPCN